MASLVADIRAGVGPSQLQTVNIGGGLPVDYSGANSTPLFAE